MSHFPACLVLAGLLSALPVPPAAAQPPATDPYGDPLPPGARARLGTVRFRHGWPVLFVAFSPDGKVLAASASNGSFSLWEACSTATSRSGSGTSPPTRNATACSGRRPR
jgi:hypothetical protein